MKNNTTILAVIILFIPLLPLFFNSELGANEKTELDELIKKYQSEKDAHFSQRQQTIYQIGRNEHPRALDFLMKIFEKESEPFIINRGDRIAQLVIAPVIQVEFVESETLPETSRSGGGFGHTGVK